VVIDLVWREVIPHVIEHANLDARIVQVGNVAGATSPIDAPAFRNRHVSIIGSSNFLVPIEVRRRAFAQMMGHAVDGDFGLELERMPLESVTLADPLHVGGLDNAPTLEAHIAFTMMLGRGDLVGRPETFDR
jgi:NADPH:quinone reductase-like Zn-dependent oxidoreductase